MLTCKVGAVVTTAKGQNGKLTTQEWGRIYNILKKNLANFSLRIKKEKKAVRKGIRFIVKTVFATVVDVIDKMKHIFDKLNTIPPRSP